VQLAWAIPCRFAEAMADGTATLVGAGFDSIWVGALPADVSMVLMMRITGARYEFEEAHRLAVRIIDPQTEEQDVLAADFGALGEPPPLRHLGLDPFILAPATIRWQAGHHGLYTIEVHLDERRGRSIPILVRDAAELQPQRP
jgi:hypothetical protein